MDHRENRETFIPPNTLRACIPWFIGGTLKNLISSVHENQNVSYESALLDGGIVAGLALLISKVVTRRDCVRTERVPDTIHVYSDQTVFEEVDQDALDRMLKYIEEKGDK